MTKKQREALEAAQAKYRDALGAVVDAADDIDEADLAELEDAVATAKDDLDEAERVAANYDKREQARKALEAIPAPVVEAEPQPERTVAAGEVRVGREPMTYGREADGRDAQRSFVRDMLAVAKDRNKEAAEHLMRHAQEMAVETRDSTTTDTTSLGEMVPPMWMVEKFAKIARAGRPLANALGSMDLPAGTENIIVPKVTTGGSVHFQTAQNTAIAEQDMVTGGTAQAVVKTIAGQIDTSLQSVEWAPLNMVDSFFLPELASLHANIFETSVGAANNTNGAWQGILGTSGTQTVTYTAATPTAGTLYSKIADAIQQIHVNRFLPPNLIVMHPRRWGWLTAQSDTTGRPLFLPRGMDPQNAMGVPGEVVSEGFVGTTGHGLPVLVSSAAVTTADASGTTNDVVLVMRREDQWIWESPIRTRVLYEVLSGALTVRIQLYNYSATMFDRYPKSISAVRGTGLATPSF
jgi:HK97 family phage major capsid protein